jgi:hypothetical protein
MVFAFTLRSLTSTLLPVRTIGMFSQTRTKSPGQETLVWQYAEFRLILTVPVRNIFVCDAGGDVEHDDAALAVDIVTVTKTSELFLSSSIPDIELDVAQILDNGQ